MSQTKWGLKYGEGMGECNEYAWVNLAGILAEIDSMGAASDFSSKQKQLKKCKDEMILLIKVPDDLSDEHDVNFFWCQKASVRDKYKAVRVHARACLPSCCSKRTHTS